jgi:hypothetical protein
VYIPDIYKPEYYVNSQLTLEDFYNETTESYNFKVCDTDSGTYNYFFEYLESVE